MAKNHIKRAKVWSHLKVEGLLILTKNVKSLRLFLQELFCAKIFVLLILQKLCISIMMQLHIICNCLFSNMLLSQQNTIPSIELKEFFRQKEAKIFVFISWFFSPLKYFLSSVIFDLLLAHILYKPPFKNVYLCKKK